MVKITGFQTRNNGGGQPFIVLELQSGEPEIVQSKETGNFYLTFRKTSISSTLSEEEAMLMVGRELKGTIKKMQVEAYEITDEKSGDIVELHHKYQYAPEESPEVTTSTPLRAVA
jgi:hypothetical protein